MWLFILPLSVGIITQIIKLVVDKFCNRFEWKNAFAYGGMPSAHSSIVFSLMTIVYKLEGLHSVLFMVTLTLSFFILWDAMKLRKIVEHHAKRLNSLKTGNEKMHLTEHVGHTLFQVVVGALIGILLTIFALQNIFTL